MERGPVIVAGFGFSSRASTASLRGALERAQERSQGEMRIDALATLADKAAALEPLAQALGLPLIAVTPPLPDTPTQSPRSLAARGSGSVAEACALAGAGAGAYLRCGRTLSPDRLATCATAQGGQE